MENLPVEIIDNFERITVTDKELNSLDKYIYTISETVVDDSTVNIEIGYLYRERKP